MPVKRETYSGLHILGPMLGLPGLSGNTYVEQLQRALTNLSKVVSDPKVDPKTTSGKFDCKTAKALSAAVPHIKKIPAAAAKIPKEVWTVLEVAKCAICIVENPLGELWDCAKQLGGLGQTAEEQQQAASDQQTIEQNAPAITTAINTAANQGANVSTDTAAATTTSAQEQIRQLLAKWGRIAPVAGTRQKLAPINVGAYPTGSVTALDEKLGKWRVAVPKGSMKVSTPSGFGCSCGLGQPRRGESRFPRIPITVPPYTGPMPIIPLDPEHMLPPPSGFGQPTLWLQLGQTVMTTTEYEALLAKGTAYEEVTLIPPTSAQPKTATTITLDQYKKLVKTRLYDAPKAWYEKPLIWAIAGGVVLVAAGGGFVLLRRRRRGSEAAPSLAPAVAGYRRYR